MMDISIAQSIADAGIPVKLGCLTATVHPARGDDELRELLATVAAAGSLEVWCVENTASAGREAAGRS